MFQCKIWKHRPWPHQELTQPKSLQGAVFHVQWTNTFVIILHLFLKKLDMCGGLTLTRVTFSTSSQPMVQENWEWWFWSVHHVLSLLILPSFSGEGLHTLALLQHGISPRGDSPPWTLQCGLFPCLTWNPGVAALSATSDPLESGTKEPSSSGWRNNTRGW